MIALVLAFVIAHGRARARVCDRARVVMRIRLLRRQAEPGVRLRTHTENMFWGRSRRTVAHMVAQVSCFIMWFTALQTLHVYMSMFRLRVYHDAFHTLAYTALVRPVGRRAGHPALGQVTPAAGGWARG